MAASWLWALLWTFGGLAAVTNAWRLHYAPITFRMRRILYNIERLATGVSLNVIGLLCAEWYTR